ncbi:2-hydroxy-3-oxopropionate reductase [Mangrovactinospora gilvigrisea]|uniref:2-hydroxy-3-oxopropionate reductase n=1 Tax=Mangrovactinospora gilvigrisea TaxID=1428644 RepID=A0A1J7BG93_9ACTN|nr:2-hydroxy-3-oxopropionate reductase [Mangrovactinospora gilvigrisea]OIV37695.1 2-hydroxy-3-oxopropionate reductase [Mangrovactinospora gilvigrisea]
MKVAFIGLGIMGGPMAANLVRAGHDVLGHNRSRPAVDRLVEAGGRAAGSVAEAVRDAEAIITMLPADPQVTEVAYGDDGILAHAPQGALLIDMSTVTPATSAKLAADGAERGLRVLDAPVSGGEAGAVEGVLSIMVGGEAAHLDAARPLLDALGTTVVHVGPAGAGQTVKAANQLMVAVHIEALAEAAVFLKASGADLEAALRVLGGGLAGSTVLQRKQGNVLGEQYAPGFRLDLHRKDLGIVMDAARELGLALPAGSLAAQLVASACANGDGGLDHSALLRGVQRLNGAVVSPTEREDVA